MPNAGGEKYIIVVNHDRGEFSVVSEERVIREFTNYEKKGRNIENYVSEFPNQDAALAYAKEKYEKKEYHYHFLHDYKDVLKELESDPRPR